MYLYIVNNDKRSFKSKTAGYRINTAEKLMEKLINAIIEIAKSNPSGFTVEIPSLKKVTKGWAVAYKDTQNSFDLEGLQKVIKHAKSHDQKVGGWLEKNCFYFDSIKIIEDEQEATDFGKSQQQIAIYEIHTNRLKYL